MFFLICWLFWPVTALIRACLGCGNDQHYRETILKFWTLGLILTSSLVFLWLTTFWLVFALLGGVSYLFYGLQLRTVVIEEHGVDIYD